MTQGRERAEKIQRWLLPGLNLVAAFALFGWILYDACGQNFFGIRPWPDSVVDFHILYDSSLKIVREGRYGTDLIFPYPPSAVALLRLTALPEFPVAAAIWLSLTLLATGGAVIAGSGLVGSWQLPGRWIAALAAYALASYFIQWDLRSQNCNMIYCFLLIAGLAAVKRGNDYLAGALLAASVALKLYPVLVLPYLWFVGRRRAWGAMLFFMGLFFLALPAAFFGFDNLLGIYTSWLTHLRFIAETIDASGHPILIALPFTLAKRLGPGSPFLHWLLAAAWVAWLGTVAACLIAGRSWRSRRVDGWDLAVDGGILALAPVIVSPYLEPYHAAPAIALFLALVQGITDPSRAPKARWLAAGALVFGWLALRSSGFIDCRGVGVLAQMSSAALGLAALRALSPGCVQPIDVCSGNTNQMRGRVKAA